MRGDSRLPGADPLRQARQGAVHLAPRRRPRASSARSASRSSRSRSPRASRPGPKVSFGLALSVGPRERRRVPRRRAHRAGRHRRARRASHPGAARGHAPSPAPCARRPRARAAGGDHRSRVPGRGRRRPRPARPGGGARRGCVARAGVRRARRSTRTRKGKESVDDIRPALRDHRGRPRRRHARARAHPVDATPRCPTP